MTTPRFKLGIIIQARNGSTRLPGKMMMPFYQENPLIAEIIDRVKRVVCAQTPIILATTISKSDDEICKVANDKAIHCYRGSEDDVLQRFIDAGNHYQINTIVRICADNPFLDMEGTMKLGEFWNDSIDYLSYQVKGNRPSILSHLGLWGEWVSVRALLDVANNVNESIYHEHVTNYLYSHRDMYTVKLVDAPDIFYSRNDIRLTVDTLDDFELTRDMYHRFVEQNKSFKPDAILKYLDEHKDLVEKMKLQIAKNTK